ncbi:DUF3887 domain-containing protein [Proteiniclasticum sp. QWL-01]|uniref:DUF3887 domain-containing protein n=1 Tax=Proteiniclasticum sp. QWL-01 TaxID=3036945 RepID=UPI0022003C5A|nr:DUF3887 domain-containing protein [Proteiniclasticum sp. QWL-01]UUM11318.1 DUF3887 domain-containing protein [Clostridiaceae bacterium HFYG-1003]WFF72713.1 DUF3887 domain-containing protein [Proteiniclasticum sp. QWL-01]
MKRKHRGLTLLLFVLTLSLALAACAQKTLPEGFDQAKVTTQAKQVITQLTNKEYASVAAQFSPEMKAALDAQKLQTAVGPVIDKLGAFKEFKSETVGAGENPTIGKYAVAIINCVYANGNATYTISIDSAGKVCGLYVK